MKSNQQPLILLIKCNNRIQRPENHEITWWYDLHLLFRWSRPSPTPPTCPTLSSSYWPSTPAWWRKWPSSCTFSWMRTPDCQPSTWLAHSSSFSCTPARTSCPLEGSWQPPTSSKLSGIKSFFQIICVSQGLPKLIAVSQFSRVLGVEEIDRVQSNLSKRNISSME